MTRCLCSVSVILLTLASNSCATQYGIPVKTISSQVDSNQPAASAPQGSWSYSEQSPSQQQYSQTQLQYSQQPQYSQIQPQYSQMQPQYSQQPQYSVQPMWSQWSVPPVPVIPVSSPAQSASQSIQHTPQVIPLRVPGKTQQFAQQQPSNQQASYPQATQQIPSQAGNPTQPVQLSAALQHVHEAEHLKMAESDVVAASNDFATDLYEEVRHEPGNLVISPLSVSAVLALAWLGAYGRTAQLISTTLHLSSDVNLVIEGYRHLFQSLKASGGAHLETGSRVFARRGLGVNEGFRRAAQHVFGADAEELDFAQPAVAAAAVNGWVQQRTRGKIQQLIEPQALSPETSLLLANAVYFKGRWQTQFDPEHTTLRPFRTGPPGAAPAGNVSLMYTQGDFPYAHIEELKAKVVRMPYVGGRLSMVVVLPDAADGLAAVEAALRGRAWPLRRLLETLRVDEVHVWLPRFTAHAALTLNGPLAQLGLGELFGGNANFSGLAAGGGFLSRVVQKAFIEVNEEGSEAAAASGGIFLLSAGLYNFFKADHPFLFYILDDQTGAILFQGHFLQPDEAFLQ